MLAAAPAIDKSLFFLLHAGEYAPEELRRRLPEAEFQQAITTIEAIASKTEDRMMYDQREKAQRDYAGAMKSARDEGIKMGREEGREEGLLAGKVQLLQQLLNQEPSPTASLLERPPDELALMLSDLQQQLRSRS